MGQNQDIYKGGGTLEGPGRNGGISFRIRHRAYSGIISDLAGGFFVLDSDLVGRISLAEIPYVKLILQGVGLY